jgi:hypothetical protein
LEELLPVVLSCGQRQLKEKKNFSCPIFWLISFFLCLILLLLLLLQSGLFHAPASVLCFLS